MKSVAAYPLGRGGTRAQPSRLCKQAGCLFPMPISSPDMNHCQHSGWRISRRVIVGQPPRLLRTYRGFINWILTVYAR